MTLCWLGPSCIFALIQVIMPHIVIQKQPIDWKQQQQQQQKMPVILWQSFKASGKTGLRTKLYFDVIPSSNQAFWLFYKILTEEFCSRLTISLSKVLFTCPAKKSIKPKLSENVCSALHVILIRFFITCHRRQRGLKFLAMSVCDYLFVIIEKYSMNQNSREIITGCTSTTCSVLST